MGQKHALFAALGGGIGKGGGVGFSVGVVWANDSDAAKNWNFGVNIPIKSKYMKEITKEVKDRIRDNLAASLGLNFQDLWENSFAGGYDEFLKFEREYKQAMVKASTQIYQSGTLGITLGTGLNSFGVSFSLGTGWGVYGFNMWQLLPFSKVDYR